MSKQEFIQTPTFGKFAAIYVRVSQYEFSRDFKGQKQLRQSVITQKQDAINYCQDKGWSYRIYDQDSELSGSMLPDAEKGRKDLARLLKDIECGLIHTVVCRDIRRISRNTLLLTKLIHEHFIPHGVNLISLSENIDISTSYGRMFVSIMGEFAQIELHYHKTMGKRSIMAKLEEGRLATHPYCYGYKFYTRNHPEIVEEEATVIKKLFELKAYEKYTLGQLERFLIENKIPTKVKGKWRKTTIVRILTNFRYTGKVRFKGQVYNSPYPVIIEEELFNKAQSELEKNKIHRERKKRRNHLLTGILKCPICMKKQAEDKSISVNFIHQNRGTPGVSGELLEYFYCGNPHPTVPKFQGVGLQNNKIEQFVEDFFQVFNVDKYLEITFEEAELKEQLETELRTGEEKLAEIKASLETTSKRFIEEDLSVQDLAPILEKQKNLKHQLLLRAKEIKAELERINSVKLREQLKRLKKWRSLDFPEKRSLLKAVLSGILVYTDKLVIIIHSKEKYPLTVPFIQKWNRVGTDLPFLNFKDRKWNVSVMTEGILFLGDRIFLRRFFARYGRIFITRAGFYKLTENPMLRTTRLNKNRKTMKK